jgi:hypothetical protein
MRRALAVKHLVPLPVGRFFLVGHIKRRWGWTSSNGKTLDDFYVTIALKKNLGFDLFGPTFFKFKSIKIPTFPVMRFSADIFSPTFWLYRTNA